MKVLGINGIRSDGSTNTDQMLIRLDNRGHTPIDCNYRETRLFRFQTYDTGRQFEDALFIGKNYWPGEDCAVVAHSRGCLVAWRMLEIGYRFKAMFLFRPSINKDFILPRGQQNVFCIHRPDDRAIKHGSWLPFNDFGAAGRFGLEDKGVINVQAPRYVESEFFRHSDDFLSPQINVWAEWIHERLQMIERGVPVGGWPAFPHDWVLV